MDLPRYLHQDRIRLLEQLAEVHEQLAEALTNDPADAVTIEQARKLARSQRELATNEAARLAELPPPAPMPGFENIVIVPASEPGAPTVIEPISPTIEPPTIPPELLQQLTQRYTDSE